MMSHKKQEADTLANTLPREALAYPSAIVCHTIQPIADRVAQNLEILSKNFQFSTRRTRILMGFMTHTSGDSHGMYRLLLGTHRKSHGQNSGSLEKF